jgi:glycosyltransferase involved in cell wall biosynthesis
MTKVGWLSAPITATTGYGKVSRDILLLLADMGYDIVNIGGRGTTITWGEKVFIQTAKGNQILVLPCWGQVGDRGTIEYYAKRYNIDVLVSLWDAFVLPAIGKPSIPYAAYIPVDAPMTRKWAYSLVNADIIVAYSRFGYNELLKHFPDFMVRYIRHGVDATNTFKPHNVDDEDRMKLRDAWNIPRDKFVFLFLGANMGERKNVIQLLLTFKKFLDKHPDALLYLYTNMFTGFPTGYDIAGFAEQLGIPNNVMGPTFNTMLDSVEDEKLAELYACADVTVNPSLGEGFGMSILESMACGTPVIATNNSSMQELVKDHGWLVDTVPENMWVDVPVWVPTLETFTVPNLGSLYACMEDAYDHQDLRKEYGRKSREFAEQYDWPKIMPEWEALIKELLETRG